MLEDKYCYFNTSNKLSNYKFCKKNKLNKNMLKVVNLNILEKEIIN
jgi:hypothetical protein